MNYIKINLSPIIVKKISYKYKWLAILLIIIGMSACKKNDMGNTVTDLQLVADNLVSPLTVVEPPDGTKRLFVVDEIGKVWEIASDGTKMQNPFLDISGKIVTLSPSYDERGLLGLAFHPDFKNNGRLFVYYTAPPRAGGPQPGVNWNNLSRVSQFTVSAANPNQVDMNTEKVIFEADHPQLNHDGGTIAFGPDGYLYISIGDGGGADDDGPGHVEDWYKVNKGGNGQDIDSNLLGNILRIDVNSGSPYGIPADNPFVGKPGLDEIYAYGFRNPYRFSFDMGGSHQLYAGDAGQSLYEEIDIVTKGGNYGWNVKEGTHCFNTDVDTIERTGCPNVDPDGNPLIDPVIELSNISNPKGGVAAVIVGGNVYRGNAIPEFQGQYIFGIFSQKGADGKIFIAKPSSSGLWSYQDVSLKSFSNNLGQYIKGFGQSTDGEVFITTSAQLGPTGNTGKVYKLIKQ